jgi:hypothetical protein
MSRKWTKYKLKFLSDNKDKPASYVAEKLNRSANSINSKRNYSWTKGKQNIITVGESDTPERREMFSKLMYLVKVKSAQINGKANINWDKFKRAFGQVENMMEARQ